jgi:RNA polymerase sigma-70 factor (ECF subfamily)
VEARRPREPVSPTEAQAAVESFQRALTTGDFQGLLDVLAPDVVLLTDGGGLKRAAQRPVVGAGKVIRYISGGIGKGDVALSGELTVINGNPAVLLRVDEAIDGVLAVRVEDARVTGIYYVRNPEKLTRIAAATPLVRR